MGLWLIPGRDGTRVGVVVFSEQVRLVIPMNRHFDSDELRAAIVALAYLGQTTNTPGKHPEAEQIGRRHFPLLFAEKRDSRQ